MPYWDDFNVFPIIPRFHRLEALRIAIPPMVGDISLFLKSIPHIIELKLPPLSPSTLRLLSSAENLPNLQTLGTHIPPVKLSAHITMVRRRARESTRILSMLHPSPTGRLGADEVACGSENRVEETQDRNLLQLIRRDKVHAQMRDFVPSYMKPE